MVELDEVTARRLLGELKDALVDEFTMPAGGEQHKGFDVESQDGADKFRVDLYRGKIDFDKHSISARIQGGGVVLMRLCVNPSQPHSNPDGTVILGDHLHVYRSGYGENFAEPVDIESPNFINDTLLLLQRFNVVKKPLLQDAMMP